MFSGGGGASMMAQLARPPGAPASTSCGGPTTTGGCRLTATTTASPSTAPPRAVDSSGSSRTDGTVTGATYAFVSEPRSRSRARQGAPGHGRWDRSPRGLRPTSSAKAGNALLLDEHLRHHRSVSTCSRKRSATDAGSVVQVETSYRPATGGRPAGVYTLDYRVGSEPGRRLDGPLVGVVEVAPEDGWQTLTLRMIDDVRAFWPDLVAEDSGLAQAAVRGPRPRRCCRSPVSSTTSSSAALATGSSGRFGPSGTSCAGSPRRTRRSPRSSAPRSR